MITVAEQVIHSNHMVCKGFDLRCVVADDNRDNAQWQVLFHTSEAACELVGRSAKGRVGDDEYIDAEMMTFDDFQHL